MSRKWMATVFVTVLGLGLLLAGCPKPEPEVVPPPVEVPPPPPPQEVAPPPAPEPVDEEPDPLSQDLVTAQEYAVAQGLLGDVFFDFDKYNLKPESLDRLKKNADFMRQHPQFVFTLEGHCDERGTNDYNIALGTKRAAAARAYLEQLGVSGSRLKTLSLGEERPFCFEHDESCWSRNRRAHFVITDKIAG